MDHYVNDAQSLSEALVRQAENPGTDTIFITADIDLTEAASLGSSYYVEFGVRSGDSLIINGLGHSIIGHENGLMLINGYGFVDGNVFIGNLTFDGGNLIGANGHDAGQGTSGKENMLGGGGHGSNGGNGGAGSSALGAGLAIMVGANVSLYNVEFIDNIAHGGDGGSGGDGGDGGYSAAWHGGHGGDGGNGGDGGAGIGAIYNAGVLRLDNVTYTSNSGIGGWGGRQGQGGLGGGSGSHWHGSDGQEGTPGAPGFSENNLYSVGQVYQDNELANVNNLFALYQALLGRTPDGQGLMYWKSILDNQVSLAIIAQNFIESYEYDTKTGISESAIDYLRKLYLNVLEREPEREGERYWIESYEAGLLTRSDIAALISQSDEAQRQVSGQFALADGHVNGDLTVAAPIMMSSDFVAMDDSSKWLWT